MSMPGSVQSPAAGLKREGLYVDQIDQASVPSPESCLKQAVSRAALQPQHAVHLHGKVSISSFSPISAVPAKTAEHSKTNTNHQCNLRYLSSY